MEKELRHNDYFIRRLFLKYLLSSILAMLCTGVGGMIDTVIVGFFLKEDGLSAMSLVGPVYLVYYTFGAIIGIGGSIVASIKIGKGKYDEYREVFTCSFVLMAALSIVLTATGLVFLDPIAAALSSGGESFSLVRDYLFYYILGGSFTLMSYIPLYFLKIDGKPRFSMLIFILFSSLNVVFTFLFMSPVCNMGIGGASLATSSSMAIASILGTILMLKLKGETRFAKILPSLKNMRSILRMGMPNGLSNLLNALKIVIINGLIVTVGGAVFLSSFTVTRTVGELMNCVMLGISSAMVAVIGVYFGEHDYVGVRRLLRLTVFVGAIIVVLLSLPIALEADTISAFFSVEDSVLIAENRFAIPAMSFSLIFAFANIILTGYFNAVKHPFLADLVIALRLIVYLAISAFGLSAVIGMKGIWLSLTATEVLTLVTLLIIMRLISKKKELDGCLLDRKSEGKEASFSVGTDSQSVAEASEKLSIFCEENEIDMKKSAKMGLYLEEILEIIIGKCLPKGKKAYIDVRVKLVKNEVILRIRSNGKIFNPLQYYEENKDNEELFDELLGIKMLIKGTKEIDFRQTFGMNNLLITL